MHHGVAEKNRDKQDLQHILVNASKNVGYVKDEVAGILGCGALRIIGYGVRVQRPGLHVEPCAGPGEHSPPSKRMISANVEITSK